MQDDAHQALTAAVVAMQSRGDGRLRMQDLDATEQEALLADAVIGLARAGGKQLDPDRVLEDRWAAALGWTSLAERSRLNRIRSQVLTQLKEEGHLVLAKGGNGWVVTPKLSAVHAEKKGPGKDRSNLGAWVLKANPAVWDLGRYQAEGHTELDDWTVADNYRSRLMSPGDLVVLWVSGNDPHVLPGVRGVGWVIGPCRPDSAGASYWLDPAAKAKARLFAQVQIHLYRSSIGRHLFQADPGLRGMEVLTQPYGANPSFLDPVERDAMIQHLEAVGPLPPYPAP
jgi:hypothetical protein